MLQTNINRVQMLMMYLKTVRLYICAKFMTTQNHSERRKAMFTLVVWQQLTVVYDTRLMRYYHVSLSRRLPVPVWQLLLKMGQQCAHKLSCWNHLTRIFSSRHDFLSLCWLLCAWEKLKGPSERAMLSFEMDISVVKLCTLIPLHLYEICTRAKQMNKQRWCSDVGVMVIHNPVTENRE